MGELITIEDRLRTKSLAAVSRLLPLTSGGLLPAPHPNPRLRRLTWHAPKQAAAGIAWTLFQPLFGDINDSRRQAPVQLASNSELIGAGIIGAVAGVWFEETGKDIEAAKSVGEQAKLRHIALAQQVGSAILVADLPDFDPYAAVYGPPDMHEPSDAFERSIAGVGFVITGPVRLAAGTRNPDTGRFYPLPAAARRHVESVPLAELYEKYSYLPIL